jgi:predicted RNA-binding protein with PUA-like domain
MKSEPDVFSIDDLKKNGSTLWEGVRNYQARNFMMKDMKIGDWVIFYHSNATPSGIAGLGKVSKLAVPDISAQDPKSEYYDPKANPQNPIWYCVEVSFVKKFKNFISLQELKNYSELEDMLVLKKGQRLSIQPVSKTHFEFIEELGTGFATKSLKPELNL